MASRSLGTLTIDLLLKTAGFDQGMSKAARTAQKRSQEIDRAIGGAFKSIGGTIAQFVAGFATVDYVMRSFMQSIDVADRIDELSNRLGISSEQLSKWGYAAKLSGTDLESLANALPRLSKNLAAAADESSRQGEIFQALGVDVKDAAGNLRDAEAIIPDLADAFKGLNNDTLEAAIAQELFGRAGAEMLEFLNRGSDGIRELGDELSTLGGVIDQETGAAAAEFKDEVDRLRVALNGAWTEIARELLPVLTELVEDLKETSTAGDGVAKTAKDIAEVASVLAQALRFVGGEFSKANEVGDSFRATLGFLDDAGLSLKSAFDSLLRLDVAGWFQGMTEYASGAARAVRAAFGQLDRPDFGNVRTSPNFGNVSSGASTVGPQSAAEGRLNRLLADRSGGSKKSSGKSEEEKEAERLQKAYESLIESMDERIALFGKEGEAAKVRYDTEFGALKGLTAELKANAIARAEQYDQMVLIKELQDAADDAVDKETEAYREHQKSVADFIDDLKFEIQLEGMSNLQKEKAIALRYANVDAMSKEGQEISALIEQYQRASEANAYWMDIQSGMEDAFYDFATGAKSAKDALGDFLDAIYSESIRAASRYFSEQLTNMFKGAGTSGGETSGWAALLGSLFGGGKQSGGWAKANTMYEVNESGMEMATVRGRDYLLTGNSGAQITPAGQWGAGGLQISMVNNFDRNNSQATPEQIAVRTGQSIQRQLARTGR